MVGNRLSDAEEILFHQPGITWKDLKFDEKSNGRYFTVTFAVAPDAQLGEHTFRVRTKSGTTYARRFWVSQYPNVLEDGDKNNSFDTPQEVPLNVTVDGTTKTETADFFKITAKKGQRISVEVEGLRANSINQRVAVDPYCAILNTERFELVSSDDTALLRQDCFVSMIAPEDGDYIVEVRDSAYESNNARYRAHIGTFPRPSGIYPAGGKAGSEIEVKLLGDVKGTYTTKVKLPNDPESTHTVFAAHEGATPPSANVVRVSGYDNVLEDEEKNDSYKSLEKSSGTLPLAFNGVLQEDNDYDYFRFTAKKGQKFRVRALAKAINSPVDPVLHVFDVNGKTIGGNDDADNSADARYDFTAPADGDYFVRVYDMLKRGGDDFVYRIETEEYTPELVVSMPEFQRRDMQFRKTMDIPRGGRFATVVNVSRKNVRTDGTFEVKNLPPGVTYKADVIPANVTSFPVVFYAAKDAPIGGKLSELWVHGENGDKKISGKYTQDIDFVRGNPNGTLYYSKTEEDLPVAVCEEAPFTLDIVKPETPVVRDGQMNLVVRANRKEGFTKPIVVRWMWRPPGISANSTVTIPEGKNEATFSVQANGNAETRSWKVCVLGEADGGNGTVRTSSDLVDLPVEDHFVKMTMNLATTKQGQPAEVLVDVEKIRDYPNAKVKLIGLPAKTEAQEVTLKPGQEQIRIPVTTNVETPVGQTKNVFCQLEFDSNGKTIQQRAAMGGVFRVDPKPKEPKPEQVAKADDKKPAQPTEKPLSRLEQLRLEAQKRAEAAQQ